MADETKGLISQRYEAALRAVAGKLRPVWLAEQRAKAAAEGLSGDELESVASERVDALTEAKIKLGMQVAYPR